MGIYVQDQWTANRLTLNMGVRFDHFEGSVPAQTRPGGYFVGPLSFGALENVPNWNDVSPRLGASYNLFGTGNTALKVSLGRYVQGDGTGFASSVNPSNAITTSASRNWNDLDGDYVPDCDLQNRLMNGECGALSSPLGSPSIVTRQSPEVGSGWGVRSYNWQSSVQLQHQLRPGVGLAVGYFRTRTGTSGPPTIWH